jgi:putative aldouronate transport system permease protein
MENKELKLGKSYYYKSATFGEKFSTFLIYSVLFIITIIFLYPILNILAQSLSGGKAVMRGEVSFFPIDFNTLAYEMILSSKRFWLSVANSAYYIIVGVTLNLLLCSMAAYALSKKHMVFRNEISIYLAITMLFSGGLIPVYILINSLGLYNTRGAIIFSSLFSVWNIIMLRTFFQGIPESYEESAKIDGAGDLKIMFMIYLPMAKPILATLALILAVGYWNSYFDSLIYLQDQSKYPVQLILRGFFVSDNNSTYDISSMYNSGQTEKAGYTYFEMQLIMQYTIIIITTVPVVALFLGVQKYFLRGVVIGGIKG